MLNEAERDAIAPVFHIKDDVIDGTSSNVELRGDFLTCSFVSNDRDRCPFEVSFGRRAEIGHFNCFIGLGAEFYNYEPFDDEESRAGIRQDLDLFLKSAVRCESVMGSKGIAVQRYFASELLLDESPIQFTFRKYYVSPFSRRTTEVVSYRPWID